MSTLSLTFSFPAFSQSRSEKKRCIANGLAVETQNTKKNGSSASVSRAELMAQSIKDFEPISKAFMDLDHQLKQLRDATDSVGIATFKDLLDRRVPEVVDATLAGILKHFDVGDELGPVVYYALPKNPKILVISPFSGKSNLNRLASALHKRGDLLTVDPAAILRTGFTAFRWIKDTPIEASIKLSMQEVRELKARPWLSGHEISHLAGEERDHILMGDYSLAGKIKNKDGNTIVDGIAGLYSKFVVINEQNAYGLSLAGSSHVAWHSQLKVLTGSVRHGVRNTEATIKIYDQVISRFSKLSDVLGFRDLPEDLILSFQVDDRGTYLQVGLDRNTQLALRQVKRDFKLKDEPWLSKKENPDESKLRQNYKRSLEKLHNALLTQFQRARSDNQHILDLYKEAEKKVNELKSMTPEHYGHCKKLDASVAKVLRESNRAKREEWALLSIGSERWLKALLPNLNQKDLEDLLNFRQIQSALVAPRMYAIELLRQAKERVPASVQMARKKEFRKLIQQRKQQAGATKPQVQ